MSSERNELIRSEEQLRRCLTINTDEKTSKWKKLIVGVVVVTTRKYKLARDVYNVKNHHTLNVLVK